MGVPTRCRRIALTILALLLFTAAGCGSTPTPPLDDHGPDADAHLDRLPSLSAVTLGGGEKLRVIATTSIVADVVRQIGGDRIEMTVLLPLGSDPHSFEPTPQDVAAVIDAHVVFANGAGLELFLDALLKNAGAEGKMVPVSYGIDLLESDGEHEQEESGDHKHGSGTYDPHVWFDPNNVMIWTANIVQSLQALDPPNAAIYGSNASAYQRDLQELDGWIRQQIGRIPADSRELVTDHASFTYFAHRYGFEQVGAIFPGYSTLSEPSARELAQLEEAIGSYAVKAVFVGTTVNSSLAQQVAGDTGVQMISLYTGSLSEPGGPADSYLEMMRYNVTAIVEALR